MKTTYFITGDAGFIGSYFTRKLVEEGHIVHGLDIQSDNPNTIIANCAIGNILNEESVLEQMKGSSVVIHLAAKHHEFMAGPQKGLIIEKDDYYRTNVEGTKNVLNCATRLKVQKLIFFSSVAVYGNNMPSNEETSLMPIDDYGKSKAMAEDLIVKWVHEDIKNIALIMRPVVVFGRENWANVYQLINAINNKHFIQVGRGSNKKSMAYILNLVEATLFAFSQIEKKLEIYNYADYPILTTAEINKIIYEGLNLKKPSITIPYHLALLGGYLFDFISWTIGKNTFLSSEAVRKYTSSTLHSADLIRSKGFKQKCTIEKGLLDMISWYKNLGN